MLELDHIFCMVDDLDRVADHLESGGWALDQGSVHRGQGTRNRRLAWTEHYLELLHVSDPVEARENRLRLDRRADWASTGASPFGFGLRGRLADAARDDFWLYEDLGPRIWVHRDNERAPERPLVFVLDIADLAKRRPRARAPAPVQRGRPAALSEVRVRGPSPPSLPSYVGPQIINARGAHHLELVVGQGPARPITQILTIRG